MISPLQDNRVYHSHTPAILLVGLIIALIMGCTPAFAEGYIYLDTGTQPVLSAHAQGDTRYYPGDTFNMTVILTNKGRDTAMQVDPLLAPGAYDPSMALGVTVVPGTGDAPVTLKSLPTVVGNIGSWDEVPVIIRGTVRQNASPGIYRIPLDVTYRYVYAIPMVGADFSTIKMLYDAKEQTLQVPIRIQGEVRPAVRNEKAENLVPGTQGYLTADVENIGYATGNEVNLSIVPSDNSTFQMVDQGIYLGQFRPGDVVPLRARIAVKAGTAAGSYPAFLLGQYKDSNGVVLATAPVPLGIPVARGAVIDLVTRNLTIDPGGKETINVTYINSGDTPAFGAQARIIGSQEIVPVIDSATPGTINPGERVTVEYVLSTNSEIQGKQYVIDTEMKYRDRLDALMLSDKLTLGVEVRKPSGIDAVISNPALMIAIVGALVIIGYVGWELRKRRK